MASLFDFETAEQVRARIGKSGREQDLSIAGLSGAQQANLAGAQAGRLFAQALGGESPEVTRAKKLQEITSRIDPSNPYEGLLSGAKELQEGGFTGEAFQLLSTAQKFKPPGNKERRILKGADGFSYYENGERVLPDVKAKTASGKDGIPTDIKIEEKLRKEFIKSAGDFTKVRDSFSRIEASSKDPSAAGDLALIFNYMKMLDPESVVRESEFATAENSASVPNRVRKTWNKILTGERLAVETRADFTDRASRLFNRQTLQHDKRKDVYTGLSTRAGVNPLNVVIDIEQASPAAVETPKAALSLEELDAEILALEKKIAEGK